MKVTGLITEYNPFHNGHKYHIEKAKELTGADYIIVVMSGNFVQRGTPACMDKYLRTCMALNCGADIVIELPTLFATASAEYFALGAVKLLDSLGIVDSICFGSELGEIAPLKRILNLLLLESESFKQHLSAYLQEGDTYPAARKKALLAEFSEDDRATYEDILASPNNILGLEYLKALHLLNSPIKPYTIKRKSAGYHDQTITHSISSATSIRNELSIKNLESIKEAVPAEVYSLLKDNYKKRFPIEADDFSNELYHQLLYTTQNELQEYLDMNDELSVRILNNLTDYTSLSEFTKLIKSRNYTLTRICRSLCHVLLHIRQEQLHILHSNEDTRQLTLSNRVLPGYIRILGMRRDASFLLKKKGLNSTLPLITKVADAKNLLSEEALRQFELDIKASTLYQQKVFQKYGFKMKGEYQHGIILAD